jgi:undecaprenyl diphosphate synthase
LDFQDWDEKQENRAGIPKHIAIIMDGNGRWAVKKLLPRVLGHREGMKALKRTVKACVNLNVPILTVFAFSTENWKRPRSEVDYLMGLLIEFLDKELDELNNNGVCINILGEYTALPDKCVEKIEYARKLTRNNTKMDFNIAINYGSRQEILRAVKEVARDVREGKLEPDNISEEIFASHLYIYKMADPDLLIRTAGEMRLSNFLLWQIAYTELWVTDVKWPDFTEKHLMQAIADYQKRDRRYGGLSRN